ncbi:hypothetical protein NC651_014300 [Populus alba x Populus x berolinensis]|nr:hypothetical protein NC651_014300 [Populus alba x Populus x berolinensis]
MKKKKKVMGEEQCTICSLVGEEKQRNEMKATISRDKFWRDGMEELRPLPALMARKSPLQQRRLVSITIGFFMVMEETRKQRPESRHVDKKAYKKPTPNHHRFPAVFRISISTYIKNVLGRQALMQCLQFNYLHDNKLVKPSKLEIFLSNGINIIYFHYIADCNS